MPIDFSSQAYNTWDALGDSYQSRRITAEIVELLQQPEPEHSMFIEEDGARRIDVSGYAIIYRYIRDLALIQVIAIRQL